MTDKQTAKTLTYCFPHGYSISLGLSRYGTFRSAIEKSRRNSAKIGKFEGEFWNGLLLWNKSIEKGDGSAIDFAKPTNKNDNVKIGEELGTFPENSMKSYGR